jgi:hypothetical protein
VPKFLAVVSIAAPFIAVSAFLTSWVAFIGDLTASLAVTAAELSAWCSMRPRSSGSGSSRRRRSHRALLHRPLGGVLRRLRERGALLSIRHYAMAVTHAIDPRASTRAST